MNILFIITLIFIFLTIFIESVSLVMQLMGRKITTWLGDKAFTVHLSVTIFLWLTTFIFIIVIQFQKHPQIHNNFILRIVGSVLFLCGLFISIWAFKLLGIKRALCINFFKEDIPIVRNSIYRYLDNPMDYGLWTALIGFALFTDSLFNLIIAGEFILIMIPHVIIENIPLPKSS